MFHCSYLSFISGSCTQCMYSIQFLDTLPTLVYMLSYNNVSHVPVVEVGKQIKSKQNLRTDFYLQFLKTEQMRNFEKYLRRPLFAHSPAVPDSSLPLQI